MRCCLFRYISPIHNLHGHHCKMWSAVRWFCVLNCRALFINNNLICNYLFGMCVCVSEWCLYGYECELLVYLYNFSANIGNNVPSLVYKLIRVINSKNDCCDYIRHTWINSEDRPQNTDNGWQCERICGTLQSVKINTFPNYCWHTCIIFTPSKW